MFFAEKYVSFGLAAALLFGGVGAAFGNGAELAAARIGGGDPVAGQAKARANNCFECHGEQGASNASGYPDLAGQYAGYLVKQLRNFRSGERKNPFMSNIAASLDEADLPDIAAYFASQEKTRNGSANADAVARNLFVNGDPGRNILACARCHGDAGQGAQAGGVVYPAIGGQHMFYLREQLLNWTLGTRTNSPGRVMNKTTDAMTTAEIEALARYISGL